MELTNNSTPCTVEAMGEEAIRFGSALRELRRRAGLSQRQLAERTHLDFSYISKLENGRLSPPAADTVVALCRELGASADELLTLTGKLPSEIQQAVATNRGAQRFLQEAGRMSLTDDEWDQMATTLRKLRPGS